MDHTDAKTLNGLVEEVSAQGATIYTDEATAYESLPSVVNQFHHNSVSHSKGEYVRGDVHINGIESFWATLKRAHKGTYHQMSRKHLQHYVTEFVTKHNIRDRDTIDQMNYIVTGLVGGKLMYSDLIA